MRNLILIWYYILVFTHYQLTWVRRVKFHRCMKETNYILIAYEQFSPFQLYVKKSKTVINPNKNVPDLSNKHLIFADTF